MPDYPELFILRHGQTFWNREGRHQGQLDSDLTDLGKDQASGQGELLARLLNGRILSAFTSPSTRTRDTAELALDPLGISATPDPRLMEVHFGDWQGMLTEDIAAQWPDLYATEKGDLDWFFRSPMGETYEDLSKRTKRFLDELSEPAILVTHGITSRALRAHWLGLSYDEMKTLRGGQGNVYHLSDGALTCHTGPLSTG